MTIVWSCCYYVVKWQNQKNLVISLMPFIQGKTIQGLGQYFAPQQWSALPEEMWARVSFVEHWRRQHRNRTWIARRSGISYKASRSSFLRWGEMAKAELQDCDWCVLGFLDSEVFPMSAGWLRFRFVMWARPLGQLPFCGSQHVLITLITLSPQKRWAVN